MVFRYVWGILWAVLLLLFWGATVERVAAQEAVDPTRAIPSPLEPANTASPRDTLQSFLKYTNDTIRQLRDLTLGREVSVKRMRNSIENAQRCLDLSTLPRATRSQLGLEKTLLLKEILDRVDIPPWESIPGEEEVAERKITRWTLPGTELTIIQMEEGPRAGAFLFSADTVRQLERFYDLARELPYKPGATEGVYEFFLQIPGPWIPLRWVRNLPDWAETVYFKQAAWQWMALIGTLAIVSAAAVLIIHWGWRWDKEHEGESALWQFGQPLAVIVTFVLTVLVSRFIDMGLNITGARFLGIDLVLTIVGFGALAWLTGLVIARIGQLIIGAQKLRETNLNAPLIRISFRLLAILVVVSVVISGLENVGVPMAPLLAGLGVGGLAIALAVRPLLENVIGGFTLFLDKPVRVGDFCRYGDRIGTVEDVGVRSTRIRSLERTVVTVPNAEFSQIQLENFTKRDRMLYKIIVRLRYETTSDQLRFVLERLRRMLLGHPRVTDDPARVRLLDFGEYSLDLEIFAYVNSSDYGEYLSIREDLHLRIMDIVQEAGTGFAFPAQRAYFSRDPGLDPERVEKAEKQVENWRASDQLPFPEFEKSLRWQLQDILDFPPRGSPDYVPRRGEVETRPEPVRKLKKKRESQGRWTFKWWRSSDKVN